MELLAEHSEGLIGTTGCLNGQVPRLLLERTAHEDAREAAGRWQDIFGKENFFIELQDHGIADQHKVNPHLIELCKRAVRSRSSRRTTCTTRRKTDAKAHDVLLCIQTGATVDEPNRFRFDGEEFFLKSREEMEAALPRPPRRDRPHARRRGDVQRQAHVRRAAAARLRPAGRQHARRVPAPPHARGREAALRRSAADEVARAASTTSSASSRRWASPATSSSSPTSSNWAKGKGIRVGPGPWVGRGHDHVVLPRHHALEPLRYGLVFERFLNPERREMPDFDIDFDERYRGEVIQYLRQKYGEDRVAQIVTFATIKGKSGIRDSARVLGYPYGIGDRLAKMFPRPMLGKDPVAARLLREVEGLEVDVRVQRGGRDAEGVRGGDRLAQDARRRAASSKACGGRPACTRRPSSSDATRSSTSPRCSAPTRATSSRSTRCTPSRSSASSRWTSSASATSPSSSSRSTCCGEQGIDVRHRQRPARRPEGVRAAAARRRRRRLPAGVGRHAPAPEVSCVPTVSRTSSR